MKHAFRLFILTAVSMLFVLWVGTPADASPSPFTRTAYPDGGTIVCPPPQFTPVPISSADNQQRSVLIQVREGEGAVRIGPKYPNGLATAARKGTQLKSREWINWSVNQSDTWCTAEPNNDAGVRLDVTFGIGGTP